MIFISKDETLNALYNKRILIEREQRKLAKAMVRVRDITLCGGVDAKIEIMSVSDIFNVVRVNLHFADLQPIFKEIMKQLDDEYHKTCLAIATRRAELERTRHTSAGSC